MSEVTRILQLVEQGDRQAAAQLLPLVYDELRKLAAVRLTQEKPGQTLNATALVHEAYVRLVRPSGNKEQETGNSEGPSASDIVSLSPVSCPLFPSPAFDGRGHFFAIPVALIADDANGGNQELKALEGKWKAVAMEAGGKPFPKESVPDFTYIVAAGGKATGRSPQGEYQATITVDPRKNPKTIDNLHESGAQQGKKQYGIYKLEGDKWTVCMTLPGVAQSDRPKNFSTQDTANVVFIFERLMAAKKP